MISLWRTKDPRKQKRPEPLEVLAHPRAPPRTCSEGLSLGTSVYFVNNNEALLCPSLRRTPPRTGPKQMPLGAHGPSPTAPLLPARHKGICARGRVWKAKMLLNPGGLGGEWRASIDLAIRFWVHLTLFRFRFSLEKETRREKTWRRRLKQTRLIQERGRQPGFINTGSGPGPAEAGAHSLSRRPSFPLWRPWAAASARGGGGGRLR